MKKNSIATATNKHLRLLLVFLFYFFTLRVFAKFFFAEFRVNLLNTILKKTGNKIRISSVST